MEKRNIPDFASSSCSLRTFPNQKLFTIRWNVENCLETFVGKPLEAKFSFSTDTGTCRLTKSDTSLKFEIILKFEFYCKAAFCNKVKDVLYKDSGESSDSDEVSSDEHFFWIRIDLTALQNLPNDLLLIVCTVATNETRTVRYTSTHWNYLEDLILIANTQTAFLKEKVFLAVGEDVECVNKAILCENSPVIAEIFKSNGDHPNVINIEGIEFPVLKNVVAFLNSGILRCDDFESVYSLYNAANKCGIKKLQDACSRLLELKINAQTFGKVLSRAEYFKDFQLKNQALFFFKDHADDVLVTDQWCDLMQNEVELGLQAIAFWLQNENNKLGDKVTFNQIS